MNWLYEGSRHAAQRQIAAAITAALLAAAAVDASAEPEMTFTLSGVRATAAAAFQSEMQRAHAKVREWWGASFEAIVDAWLAMLPRRESRKKEDNLTFRPSFLLQTDAE